MHISTNKIYFIFSNASEGSKQILKNLDHCKPFFHEILQLIDFIFVNLVGIT